MSDKNNQPIIEDFLENDDPIRGQEYVCLSFISPESVIADKNLFFVKNYLKHLVNEKKINMTDEEIEKIDSTYEDFMFNQKESLEKQYYEKNNFQTTIRGLKVRGVYDTYQEAQVRAKQLQRKDKNFDIHIGQVGYWLPWDPSGHEVGKQEYFEKELNELVHKYEENQNDKDIHFRENIDYVKEQAKLEAKKQKEENEMMKTDENQKAIEDNLAEQDPWLKRKQETADDEPAPEEPVLEVESAQ